ncbi:hypothetical protein DXV76_13555 [Rhodobacteraceae bacterium CCMM004]|nr:hypothetical protein DXV76_13555 [Rhodobacteraceae bacterium CCMM004]
MKAGIAWAALALFSLGALGAGWVAVTAFVTAWSACPTGAGCAAARGAMASSGLAALVCLAMAATAARRLGGER